MDLWAKPQSRQLKQLPPSSEDGVFGSILSAKLFTRDAHRLATLLIIGAIGAFFSPLSLAGEIEAIAQASPGFLQIRATDDYGAQATITSSSLWRFAGGFNYRLSDQRFYFSVLGHYEVTKLTPPNYGNISNLDLKTFGATLTLGMDFITWSYRLSLEQGGKYLLDPSQEDPLAIATTQTRVFSLKTQYRFRGGKKNRTDLVLAASKTTPGVTTEKGSQILGGLALTGGLGYEYGYLHRVRLECSFTWDQTQASPVPSNSYELRAGIQITLPFHRKPAPFAVDDPESASY